MTVEQQREIVGKKINDINDAILGVEKNLIIAKVEELPDITFKNIRNLVWKLDSERNTLERIIGKDIRELREEYAYLLELEVEKSRGEDDKRRRVYLGDEAQEDDPFGQKK